MQTSVILAGFVGSLVAGLGTWLAALPIFLRTGWSPNAQRMMLAVAAGMMLGATFFSLIQPRSRSCTRAAATTSPPSSPSVST